MPLSKIHHLPLQSMMTNPCCLTVEMVRQNCVSQQPGIPYCDVKEHVPTFLCLQSQSHCEPRFWLTVCKTYKQSCCHITADLSAASLTLGLIICSRYEQCPAPTPSAQVQGGTRSQHVSLFVIPPLWRNGY